MIQRKERKLVFGHTTRYTCKRKGRQTDVEVEIVTYLDFPPYWSLNNPVEYIHSHEKVSAHLMTIQLGSSVLGRFEFYDMI